MPFPKRLYGLLLALPACQAPVEAPLAAAPAAIHVTTVAVAKKPLPSSLTVTGSLVANRQADVAANATGVVLHTHVERGSVVKAGDPLVELDRRTVTFSEQEARANLHSAKAQEQLAAAQCSRNQALVDKGAISKDEWERVSSQCRVTKSAAAAAQARALLALKSMRDSDVRAPFAGVIDERFVNLGEYVSPSSRIASLVELDPLRLQFTVGEADVGLVHLGQAVNFTLAAGGAGSFCGEVRYISPRVRSASRDVVIEATVSNAARLLHPGHFVTAQLRLAPQPQLSVPRQAVVEVGELRHVFVAVDGHLQQRLVQLGESQGDDVSIVDGLVAGEAVVAAPDASIHDGIDVN